MDSLFHTGDYPIFKDASHCPVLNNMRGPGSGIDNGHTEFSRFIRNRVDLPSVEAGTTHIFD
jgi:hypothetical protein